MIYMGTGGSFAPNTPHLDALIGQRLQARGFLGTRDESICLYGSMSKPHALEYALDNDEAHLRMLQPEAGAVVSWGYNVHDLLLDFASHLRDMHWGEIYRYRDIRFERLVRDIAGDVDIAETYVRLGRQKRAIGGMIDLFLDDIEILEHTVVDEDGLKEALGTHTGELWITGPCLVHAYEPSALTAAPAGL